MKKIIKYIYFISLVGMCACADSIEMDTNSRVNTTGNQTTKISLEEALENAYILLEECNVNNTKSTTSINVEYPFVSPSSQTRGSLRNDTLLYLVNFGDEEGFVLLGADSRMDAVYAFSDKGSLHMCDTTTNNGLHLFFSNLYASLPPHDDSSISVDPDTRFIEVLYKSGPLIKERPRVTWNQRSPFNAYCFDSDGNQALVGCTNLACGILMSYNQWPKVYNGRTIDWQDILDGDDTDSEAFILSEIGKLSLSKYGIKSTGAWPSNLKYAYSKFGYEQPSDSLIFNEADVYSHLNRRSKLMGPVMTYGWTSDLKTGHTWVIDGCIKYRYKNQVNDKFGEEQDNSIILFHCVWGWSGSCNGYYRLSDTGYFNESTYLDNGGTQRQSNIGYGHLYYIPPIVKK